jgi:hypothetical protein
MPAHRRAVAALAATAALLAAAPAHATPPTTTTEERQIPPMPIANCGTFALLIRATVIRELTTFYDAGGIPVRAVLDRRQEGQFTNAVTGKSIPLSGRWKLTYDYTDGVRNGVVYQTGPTYHVTVPGRGIIFLQAGHGLQVNMVTVFEHGPHDFEERNFAEVCDYLAS